MARVRFTERFKWSPPELNNTWTKVFPAGYVGTVTSPCAEAAIAAGSAVRVRSTSKKTDGVQG